MINLIYINPSLYIYQTTVEVSIDGNYEDEEEEEEEDNEVTMATTPVIANRPSKSSTTKHYIVESGD